MDNSKPNPPTEETGQSSSGVENWKEPPPPYPGKIGTTPTTTNNPPQLLASQPQPTGFWLVQRQVVLVPQDETDDEFNEYSEDVGTRMLFLRKLFGLLNFHMILIIGLICLVSFEPTMKSFFEIQDHKDTALQISLGTGLSTIMIALVVWYSESKLGTTIAQIPFAICLATTITCVSIGTGTNDVLVAVSCIEISLFLTFLFTFQSRFDFSKGIVALLATTLCIGELIVFYAVQGAAAKDDNVGSIYNNDQEWGQDITSNFVPILIISVGISTTLAAMGYLMTHAKPEETFCGVRFHRRPHQWMASAIQMYLGVLAAFLLIAFSLLLILAMLGGRFHICLWFRRVETRPRTFVIQNA